ncbi:MAG TPA: ATP:cob(I)alamin adenosyltransferase, partial [Actinophytocola sp.]
MVGGDLGSPGGRPQLPRSIDRQAERRAALDQPRQRPQTRGHPKPNRPTTPPPPPNTAALGHGGRVPKPTPRISAYADTDETNATIGTALAPRQPPERHHRRPPPDPERTLRRRRRPLHADGRRPATPTPAHHPHLHPGPGIWCDHF